MKSYSANNELTEILKKNGFVEISTVLDTKIQKQRFKYKDFSRKEFVLYNQIIAVYEAGMLQDRKVVLTEEELKMIIVYFKVSKTDSVKLLSYYVFKFDKAVTIFSDLQIELQIGSPRAMKQKEFIKTEKMLKAYNEIEL